MDGLPVPGSSSLSGSVLSCAIILIVMQSNGPLGEHVQWPLLWTAYGNMRHTRSMLLCSIFCAQLKEETSFPGLEKSKDQDP